MARVFPVFKLVLLFVIDSWLGRFTNRFNIDVDCVGSVVFVLRFFFCLFLVSSLLGIFLLGL